MRRSGNSLRYTITDPCNVLRLAEENSPKSSERSALKPLPGERFPLKTFKWATVQFNYHVELREDLHYYSVPHYLYRKEPKTRVMMIYDDRVVAIYYDHIRIAQHKRDRRPNEYSTISEHMPENHRFYAQWSPQRFRSLSSIHRRGGGEGNRCGT